MVETMMGNDPRRLNGPRYGFLGSDSGGCGSGGDVGSGWGERVCCGCDDGDLVGGGDWVLVCNSGKSCDGACDWGLVG